MNDYTILENLFKDEQDEIHFDLFKESNVIKIIIMVIITTLIMVFHLILNQ